MKVSIAQRKGNGDVVTTLIEPVMLNGTVHSVRVRRQEACGATIARFFLPDEYTVQEFCIMIFGGYVAGIFDREVTNAWNANKLQEFYYE